MSEYKSLKDPIYGYIQIDKTLLADVIDTANFQRLRNIIQTSYSPLYSSAVHNRFVHSLGVYHLGKIVSKTVHDNGNYEDVKEEGRWLYLFEIACLLHDVGHAPFSHTGEDYYLDHGDRTKLHDTIVKLTEDTILEEEIKSKHYKAASHELMSIVVSLKVFPELFHSPEEKSFFARCISGYQYSNEDKDGTLSFLNCLISLLNSSVIDVDKLDYLIRDAYITGFDTISIDYNRLLTNIRIKQDESGQYGIVYKKGAISVIENVVYAHDAERKWIQNHPVVKYEGYLQQKTIEKILQEYGEDIFSYDYLSIEGKNITDNLKIRLLCDADIIFLMKNVNDRNVNEYFARNSRRHPAWKSESEYKAIFDGLLTEDTFSIFEKAMEDLGKYLAHLPTSREINNEVLEACMEDIQETEALQAEEKDKKIRDNYDKVIQQKKKILKWIQIFCDFAKEQKIPFDFIFISANQFNSGFAKEAFSKIKIEFPGLKTPRDFGKVTNVLKADKSARDKFFFLFYRKTEKRLKENAEIHWKDLAYHLALLALREYTDNQ